MKQFCCGDVVKGCTALFEAKDEGQLLQLVAVHAREVHGLTEVSPELVKAVRANIRVASATG